MTGLKAIVAGGGLGGLTAAIALQRIGWTVRVYEQARAFGEVGAGLTIGPSATRALDGLGLGQIVRQRADIPARASVLDYRTAQPVIRRSDTAGAAPAAGESYFHQMYRSDFHRLLVETVLAAQPDAIALDSPVADVEQSASGVTAVLANGARETGDLLIASDGIRSIIRSRLFDDSPPHFTGQVAFRFLVPIERVEGVLDAFASATIMGPKAIFTRYAIRGGRTVNCVGIVETNSWTGIGWSNPASRAEVLSHFSGWHSSVIRLIEAADEADIVKWALCDREPLDDWRRGRVVLLGDAAHPVLPFLGMGAAMALEDAAVLGRALSSVAGLEAALDVYQNTRRPRTSDLLLRARRQGELYQHNSAEDYVTASPPSGDVAFMQYDAAKAPLADTTAAP